jgi:RNA polymerase sigma-32 factor
MEVRLYGQDLALEPQGDDEDTYAPIAYLPDPQEEPSTVIEAEESSRLRSKGLADALATLDPRSRRIIEARWLVEKDAATLHDLAAEFKVSAERIRQIEAKAMQKMRHLIEAH